MAKYIWDQNNDDGVRYPRDTDPQDIPESLPASPDFSEPTAPAKSQLATGRGCPKCSGDLTLFEYIKEDDLVTVRCKKCKHIWHAPDLESDELYRIIPPDYVIRHMERIDRKGVLKARQEGGDG